MPPSAPPLRGKSVRARATRPRTRLRSSPRPSPREPEPESGSAPSLESAQRAALLRRLDGHCDGLRVRDVHAVARLDLAELRLQVRVLDLQRVQGSAGRTERDRVPG